MKCNLKISKDRVATLTGSLTVKHHEQLKSIFLQIKEDADALVIDRPQAIDLCFVQLFCAFRDACKTAGRTFTCKIKLNETDERLLERTGFKNLFDVTQ